MLESERRQRVRRARCVLAGGHLWRIIAVAESAHVIECRICGKRLSEVTS